MLSRTLSWNWVGDAHDRYQVGDGLVVKVMGITGTSADDLGIEISARDTTDNTARQNLAKCKVQAKYAGTITDIRKGVVYIRLNVGVNAIVHACFDSRRPGRKDDVSFVITDIDMETGVALGIITSIIKRRMQEVGAGERLRPPPALFPQFFIAIKLQNQLSVDSV